VNTPNKTHRNETPKNHLKFLIVFIILNIFYNLHKYGVN